MGVRSRCVNRATVTSLLGRNKMNLGSLTVWFVILGVLSGMVISKYNNRLAEVHLADQLACVLNTNSSCWEESIGTPVRADWERNIVDWQRKTDNDGRILQARYIGIPGEKHRRILKRLGGIEEGSGIVFERLAHPRPLGIHNRGFRYLLNEGYE